MQRWVLASANEGKLREFQHALGPLLTAQGITLVNQSALGVASADEPFETFEENALAKARHAAAATGLPALADDSGVSVEALGGLPGVRSARFWPDASTSADVPADTLREFNALHTDTANLMWLLRQLKDVDNRSAAFCAVIAFVRAADDPHPILVKGVWPGQILHSPRGLAGFGYDPIFFDPQMQLTAAEMTLEQKQAVGHRGQALRKLLQALAL
jgi:XTP/dITP diphosphohydrolase